MRLDPNPPWIPGSYFPTSQWKMTRLSAHIGISAGEQGSEDPN